MKSNIREIDGHKYSTKPFDGHEMRIIYEVEFKDSTIIDHTISHTIYTTNTNILQVEMLIGYKCSLKYTNMKSGKIIYKATKKADEIMSEFIDEILEKI